MMKNIKFIIEGWLRANPLVFQSRWDNDIVTLVENSSDKKLAFDTAKIAQHREQKSPQGLGTYLNLILEHNVELVLCTAGFAFCPNFISTGPLPDAPPVTCMTDYANLQISLQALMAESRKNEALLLLQVLISILDGAKTIGLDVRLEEENLDKLLTNFESSFAPPAS
jgi:hypothetical protein